MGKVAARGWGKSVDNRLVIAFWIACMVVTAIIGTSKNRGGVESMLWGLLLGPLGILIVALVPRGKPPAPLGMRSVTCQRCNAEQNVPNNDTSYVCWQCKATNAVSRPSK